VHYGFGLHTIRLSLSDVVNYAKTDWASQITFACAITTTKLSLLFFYHRIFPVRTFTVISIITGIVMIGWCIALIFAVAFSCSPIGYFWDKSIKGGHCINENNLSYGITAANIVTDITVLVLPIPWLIHLQMKTSRKLAIGGIFILGSFVCVAGIVRLPFLAELKLYDVTWTIVNAGIWINVECNIGIVSACLPVMGPLLKHIPSLPKSISSRFSALFSSKRTNKTPSNKGSDISGFTMVNDYEGKPNIDGNNAFDPSHWPRQSKVTAGEGSAKFLTYRSEAEGYENGSSDDIEMLGAERAYTHARNQSLWAENSSRDQMSYPPTLPAAFLRT